MKAVGVVTECNPFHNGHRALFESIRHRFPDKGIVCVQSGNFVQRGEFAVADKYGRAEETVRGGADLVLELIPPYSVLSAESFAACAVYVLAGTGLCDTLIFGSEIPDRDRLMETAKRLSDPAFEADLAALLSEKPGLGYPAARAALYEEKYGPCPALSLPNASLGVAYIAAVLQTGASLEIDPVPRVEGDHIADATALRRMLLAGDHKNAARYMPEDSLQRLFRSAQPVSPMPLGESLLYCIRSMDPAETAQFYGFGPLAHRAASLARDCADVSGLFAGLKAAGLTDSRIRRALLALLLQIPRGVEKSRPPYALVLAAGERGRAMLATLRENPGTVPVVTKPAHIALDPALAPAGERAAFADSLYAQAQGLPGGAFLREGPRMI